MHHRSPLLLLPLLAVLLWPGLASAERIKDIARMEGDRDYTLIGTGLVIGLAGTGDGNGFRPAIDGLANSLQRLGHSVDPTQLRTKNVAMVTVEARLSRSVRPGSRVDVTVSSVGDASSLQGGFLMITQLAGATDGIVYATASGPMSIGGFNVEGGANNRIQKNHSTVGRIPLGATVERPPPMPAMEASSTGIILNHPDRGTASRVAQAVNGRFPGTARAQDAGYVRLELPASWRHDPVGFLAAVEELPTEVSSRARVVINERTGTIVVGKGVTLGEAAIAHGSLNVEIRTRYRVSQPNSFNESGETVVVPDVQTRIHETEAHVLRLPAASTVSDIVDVLNGMGATPRDIIAILQGLQAAGSLQAELVIQ